MRGRKITILEGQSIWDIALQEYGSAEGAFLLTKDNPGLELSTLLIPGKKLFILSPPVNEQVVLQYKKLNHQPSGKRMRELVVNGNYSPSDMGNWSGNVNADTEAFNFWTHIDKKARQPLEGLVPGKEYLVSINFMEIWGVPVGGEKISVDLGKDSNASDGTLDPGSSKDLFVPGRYEFILTADDAGPYIFILGENGIECRFKDVSVIEIV